LEDTSRETALAHLARDVELLASVAGDIRRVTAIGPKSAEASFASLQVQMTASGPATLRWSVRGAPNTATGLELALIGERGEVTLKIDENSAADGRAAWELETNSRDEQSRRTLEPYDPVRIAIEQLAAAVGETDGQLRTAWSTWESATRAMEVVDAVDLSLEKGRSIDVFQQQLTERMAFRGTMAAFGCGLLLVGFMALVVITMLGGAERQGRAPLLPAWEVVLLAVLAFFLLLQVIPLLVHKAREGAGPAEEEARIDNR
jgi:hypothetical protein